MEFPWQQFLIALGVVVWAVGSLVVGLRANATGKAYLRRFPPVRGIPLDMYADWDQGGRSWGGPVRRAYHERQADAALEQLRQAAWRRTWLALAWFFGFPLLVGTAVALVTVYTHLR